MKNFKKIPRQSNKNSWIAGMVLLAIVVFVFGWLGITFSKIAITKEADGQSLSMHTKRMYESQNVVQAKRGTIYDAVGNPLAENTTTYTLAVVVDRSAGKGNYAKKNQFHHIAVKLQSVLGGKVTTYEKALLKRNKNTYQVEFGNVGSNLKATVYKKINKMKLPGVVFSTSMARLYPNGVFASQLIGLASTTEKNTLTTLVGKTGLEAAYNKQLSGTNGYSASSSDSHDSSVKSKNKAVKNGNDIYTTLNSTLQKSLEGLMNTLDGDMQAKSMLAVMMDAKTGDIVAASQRPSYNATTGDGIGSIWTNLLTEDAYEPGSVLKGMTVAAAIQTNNWDPDDTYDSGTLKIGADSKVTDWNDAKGWGKISYAEGIARSSNVAMALTEQKMGASTWQHYLKAFRFLKSTNSGLKNEDSGMYQFSYPIEQANTAYGQAITVTPMQILQAYTAIAGNGEIVKPNLISKIVNPNTKKVVYQSKRKVIGKPISKATAKAVRKQLEDVVYKDYGTGVAYAIDGVKVTGKTGSAQVATSAGYSKNDPTKEIYSWIGMAPANKPKYIMYIVVKQPSKNAENPTKYMSNVFNTLMKQALNMTDSDNKVISSKKQNISVPTVVGESQVGAKKEVTAANLQAIVMGDGGTIKSQSPVGGRAILTNQHVFLNTGSNIKVPAMGGWSKSDVLAWAKLANVKIIVKGNGFVSAQSVEAGTNIEDGIHEITVEFKQHNAD